LEKSTAVNEPISVSSAYREEISWLLLAPVLTLIV